MFSCFKKLKKEKEEVTAVTTKEQPVLLSRGEAANRAAINKLAIENQRMEYVKQRFSTKAAASCIAASSESGHSDTKLHFSSFAHSLPPSAIKAALLQTTTYSTLLEAGYTVDIAEIDVVDLVDPSEKGRVVVTIKWGE